MPAYERHICFVSGHNVAEFLGALAPQTSCAHIHALVSAEMTEKALDLQKSCLRRNLGFTAHRLADTNPGAINSIMDQILRHHPGASFAVNISGGTKLMALAAFEWAAGKDIDTAKHEIHTHDRGKWQRCELPDLLTYDMLLGLYGYEIVSQGKIPSSPQNVDALAELARVASLPYGPEAFSFLNKMAERASKNSSLQSEHRKAPPPFREILNICKKVGKLDYDKYFLRFASEEARQWCNGLWLEEYVARTLLELKREGKISSWASALNASRNLVKNEIDAIFTANNRLYLIECKSTPLKSKGSPVLYKAASMGERLGGIFTEFMICSIDGLSAGDAGRAGNFNIKSVAGADLLNLRQRLLDLTG